MCDFKVGDVVTHRGHPGVRFTVLSDKKFQDRFVLQSNESGRVIYGSPHELKPAPRQVEIEYAVFKSALNRARSLVATNAADLSLPECEATEWTNTTDWTRFIITYTDGKPTAIRLSE